MNLSEYLLIFKSSLALDENAMNGGLFARKSTLYKLTMIKGCTPHKICQFPALIKMTMNSG